MTLYLTEHEELTLKEVAHTRQRPVTQLVQEAIDAWEGKDPLCCSLCVNNTKMKRTWEGTIHRRAFRAGK